MNNLKSKLKSKMKKQGGFTLVEMLIVVAIIAILIMVSIPVVNSALERAKEATDQANERSAFGAAEVRYLASMGAKSGDTDYIDWAGTDAAGKTYVYKVTGGQGQLVDTADEGAEGFIYGQCADHLKGYLTVKILKDGTIQMKWNSGSSSHNGYPTIS